MKAKRRKASAPREHERMLQQQRRAHLNEIIKKGKSEPFSTKDRFRILQILIDVRAGYDVRAWFGIQPKLGRRAHREGSHKWIVLYYLKLRALEPEKLDKIHRSIVTAATGMSDSMLRGIIRKYRRECTPLLDNPRMTLDAIKSVATLTLEKSS